MIRIEIKGFAPIGIMDSITEWKGKPVEKRGRKATGLKLENYDSRAAEYL